MQRPNVAFTRPEIAALLPSYELISDVLSGEVAVKAAGTKYLPKPNASDKSPQNEERYRAYLRRAVFYNVAQRTLEGLVGQLFLREPNIEVPTGLDVLVENATGSGLTLKQFAKRTANYTTAYSRCGLMVDYPSAGDAMFASKADIAEGRMRPTLYVYPPNEIVNWRVVDRGAEEILSLVVIRETFCAQDDGFEMKSAGQFRVLRLDENQKYVHEIWREPSPTTFENKGKLIKGNYELHQTFYPRDHRGNRLREIPFTFVGSENNDPNPDNPNFYNICSLNIAHFRNSADYEESCFITGQPTPVITGVTEEWIKNILGGTVNFGSVGGIPLPVGGDAKLLQAEANTMIKEAMDAKERQMVALGARLVEVKSVQRTATEVGIENSKEISSLINIADNVSSAIEWALKFAARWIGENDSQISFRLNKDFEMGDLTGSDRGQLLREWQAGVITWQELRDSLRRAGIATVDDDLAFAELEAKEAKKLQEQISLDEQSSTYP